MTAKEYLGQIKRLDEVIRQNLAEQNKLRIEGETLRSFDYSGDKVQSSPQNEAPYAATVEKIIDLDNQINDEIDELVELRRKITTEIQSLDNPVYVTLLHKRYVEFKPFSDIADEMDYSFEWIRHLHGLALDAFAEKWKLDTQQHICL